MQFDAALVVIPFLAVLAPLLARGAGRWLRVPIVVFELFLGILVGPSVLGWVGTNDYIDLVAQFGVAMLFFVAGTEIDFASIDSRLARRSVGGWVISLVAGLIVGWAIAPGDAAIIIAVALSSTALGTILPILRDLGELQTPFGRAVGAVGAVGEFGPLLAISLFLGTRDFGVSTFVLASFAVVAAVAILLAIRLPQGALHRAVNATLHTSSQFAVRVVMLILTSLVGVSMLLDLDFLLGAFVAGIVWRLIMRDANPKDRDAVESKVEGIAFGFLVPVFFIYTGVTFDLASLLADPQLLWFLPLGLIVLLLIRGVPATLASPPGSSVGERASLGFLGATGLPIIVAVTSIGVDEGYISSAVAAILVGIGMLSVLVFPLVALGLRHKGPATGSALESELG